jgi:hypothetical protein
MPRRRNSAALTRAERRIEGVQTIDTKLNLGNGLSVDGYNTIIADVREKLAAYNQARSLVDKTQNALLEAERAINNYSEQILLGIGARYGKDSDEYEMAGGTRKSNRRKSRTSANQTTPLS